jgi:hypothetical protein
MNEPKEMRVFVAEEILKDYEPQRNDQEWTPEYLDSFWADCDCSTALERACNAIKAALAAEREELEHSRSVSQSWFEKYNKLKQQLLEAEKKWKHV